MSGFSCLFLDLDDTLYPSDSGVWAAIGARIVSFIEHKLSLSTPEAIALRREYTGYYGTTLRGLIAHHRIDPHEYMAYVHDIALGEMIRPDPELAQMLRRLPQQIIVFTNADQAHAGRVLQTLGISEHIDRVVGYFELAPHNKPDPEAYAIALSLAGNVEPHRCVLVDDQPRNLAPATRLGMTTVLVGADSVEGFHGHRIERISQLDRCLPALLSSQPDD